MQHLPNLFLVGAVKAGTTSLHRILSDHPDIYMSPIKEPNFFSQADMRSDLFVDNYRKSISINLNRYLKGSMRKTIHIANVETWDNYLKLFKNVRDERIIGEASNSYLFCPSAAKQISRRLPDAKIMMILRNPIERAWSHYLMNKKLGYRVNKVFLDEFLHDSSINPRGWGITANYRDIGMYAQQLKNFLLFFPTRQIKMIIYDDFRSAPLETLRDVFKFLDVDPNYKYNTNIKKNQASLPRLPFLNSLIYRTGIAPIIKHLLPVKGTNILEYLLFSRSSIPRLDTSGKTFLSRIYKDEVEELSELTQRDLRHWLVPPPSG